MKGLILQLCKYKNMDIIAGAVCAEREYLNATILQKLSIPNFMGDLKEKKAFRILKEVG